MYIKRLEFENLRTFERAEVEFNYPGNPRGPVEFDNVNLLLGENASGKTTVLKAVALGTLAPILGGSTGFVPYSLVRRAPQANSEKSSVRAHVYADDNEAFRQFSDQIASLVLAKVKMYGFSDRVMSIPEGSGSLFSVGLWEADTGLLMVSYGATRRVDFDGSTLSEESRQKARFIRYSRVAGLFEEGITLVSLSSWLGRLQVGQLSIQGRLISKQRHHDVVSLLNLLLDDHATIKNDQDFDETLVDLKETAVPISALSDGYRAFLGWTSDLLYHLVAATPDDRALRDQSGIVLVDEIDLHLHPEWQQRVIPTVARTFPNLQFIFTSHSPLVVGTLRQANVFVLERDERGVSQIRPSSSEVYGLSADQILTSENFGLRSTRASGFVKQLEQKALEAREGDADAAIEFLDMVTLGAAADPASLGAEASRKKS